MADSGKGDRRQAAAEPLQKVWHRVVVLGAAKKEGREFLTAGQYEHVVDLVRQLAGFGRRDFESALSIAPFGDFWELKDKGHVLGNINLRVYFAYDGERNDVIVLSAYKKEEDRATSKSIMIRLKYRLRLYLGGELAQGCSTYEKPDDTR